MQMNERVKQIMTAGLVLIVVLAVMVTELGAQSTNGTVKTIQKISELSGGGPNLDAYDWFGSSVAGISDLNGDGVKDLAAGAWADDDGAFFAGAVYVLFMNTNGTVKSYQKISTTTGGGPNLDMDDYFGCSVVSISDLDGDGVQDLAAGAEWDDDGATDAGAVYVLFMNGWSDSDGDSMADNWETTFGLNSNTNDAMDDLDGDGFDNLLEYIADTDPSDPNSLFAVIGIYPSNGGIRVEWTGGDEARQFLERRVDLASQIEQWATIFTNNPPTSTTTNVTDPNATNAAGFYRLRAQRP